ncbi:hypothetical protein Rhopal_006524-T1 [Rhodotorula paludigena]|uniref:VTT domain-containing protein n=1 Tax=Rhodotorula paludigena TaxID=86838 RepID=A0AAV5GVF7_9BASI|nr:hypothetical protein Rhopal_006524-T1 [Rhodotorula paludigena]
MPRSRSSTLTSTSTPSRPSTPREHVASNPAHLVASQHPHHGQPPHEALQPEHLVRAQDYGVPQSYRSEHSLRTLRRAHGSDDEDDDDDAGSGNGMDEGGKGTGALGAGGRRTGPQFVIDLAPTGGAPGEGAAPTTRPRASTFGGVELPETPNPAANATLQQLSPDPSAGGAGASGADAGEHAHPPQRPVLLSRQRSTSVSSLSSLRSLDPSLHLGGAPLRERRPVLYAGLQAGAILLVSVLGLWLLLKGLLPPIDEEHQDKVKLPKSFDDLKQLNEVLQVYKDRNYWRVMGCYVTVYFFLQAFSVPGSMYLSILGGALFGVLIALPLVCFCVATGALLCYYMSAALGPAVLLHSEVWQQRIDAWTARVKKHESNLISYLVILRIAPLPPHWVVNVVAPHLGISPLKFWISTFLGIAGVSYIHTQIGTTLDQMTSSSDFHLVSWQNALGLGGIILAVLVPVLLRRYFASDLADAASDPAPEPSEPLLHPRESLSLDAEGQQRGTPRELLDGTTRSSTDGSAWVRRYSDFEVGSDGGDEGDEEQRVGGSGSGRPVLKSGGGSRDKVSRLLGVQNP